jgi:hypothetical protein
VGACKFIKIKTVTPDLLTCMHKPYGKAQLFKEKADKADLEKLAKLVKIVGLLLQTKVYLFWRSP